MLGDLNGWGGDRVRMGITIAFEALKIIIMEEEWPTSVLKSCVWVNILQSQEFS